MQILEELAAHETLIFTLGEPT